MTEINDEPVDFTVAAPGQTAYVYIDPERLSEHYCVFQLDWFDERDGPVSLRRQKWLLLDDEPFELEGPGTDIVDENTRPEPPM